MAPDIDKAQTEEIKRITKTISNMVKFTVKLEEDSKTLALMIEKIYNICGKTVERAKRNSISYRKELGCGKVLSNNIQYLYGELHVSDFIGVMERARGQGAEALRNAVFYDLGSGLGKLVIAAVTFP